MSHFRFSRSLPEFAVPKTYNLRLTPDLVAGTVTGTVAVDVDVREDTRFLVLNAVDVSVNFESVFFTTSSSRKVPIAVIKQFEENETVVGVLCTYEHNGEKKNVALTQFELADARRCFPCWDDPAFKATFKITLEVPTELVALSNMPVLEEKVNGNLKIVSYQESPVMPTYLVAIVVGLFDYAEVHTSDGIRVRVYCREGKADQGRSALHVGEKTLDLFKEYFAVPYPLPKLDMIAVPDFAAGSSEIYGLIAYPETSLLYDEKHSAASNKFMPEEHEPLLNATTMSGNAGNNVDSNQFFGNKTTTSQDPGDDPMLGAAPDASQMNQFLHILGLYFNPEQIKSLNPEPQSMTLKPEFLPLLNSTEAMMALQEALFSGYWTTTCQAREQTGATTGTGNNVEEMEICADDVVQNKKTGAIGAVSQCSQHKLSVAWIDSAELETLGTDEVVLVSRSFNQGQSICSVTERKKLGVICGIDAKVDLATSTGVITHQDIGTEFLERIKGFFVHDYVKHQSWVGSVEALELSIKVEYEDGNKVTLDEPDPDILVPIFTNALEYYVNKPYYKGQTVVTYLNSGEEDRGRVLRHGVNTVTVFWIATCVPGWTKPPELLRYTKVERLHDSRFSQGAWRLGDRCVFRGEDFLVANLRSRFKVKWQDGMFEYVDGRELVVGSEKNLFSGQFVSKKNLTSEGGVMRMLVNGVAWVKWFNSQQHPELLYAVELTHHPVYKFRVSDLVARPRVRSGNEKFSVSEPFGFVIGLEDGRVQIGWEDQTTSMVGPEEIVRLGHICGDDDSSDDDDDAPAYDDDDNSSDDDDDAPRGSGETASDDGDYSSGDDVTDEEL